MGTAGELNERFAMPGALEFGAAPSGLIFAQVTTPQARARVYLQGAHLTEWTPMGQSPMLFLSERTELSPGKAIRGGVPVIFPWFGPRTDGQPGPSHGFARTTEWELAFAAATGEAVHLTFTLQPSEATRALGFDHFRLAYRLEIGHTLTMELTVANDAGPGGAPLAFEEALHTYFAVGDAERTAVTGLGGTTYLDKRDGMRRKVQSEGPIQLTGTTDRVYVETTGDCMIEDTAQRRRIVVRKSGSRSTVVWNPWAEVAATLPDMEPEGWRGMVCVETANVGQDAVTLGPGETHTLRAVIALEPLA